MKAALIDAPTKDVSRREESSAPLLEYRSVYDQYVKYLKMPRLVAVVNATGTHEEEEELEKVMPSCLERRPDGEISIKGHRITLFGFLEMILPFNKPLQPTIQELQRTFPTVSNDCIYDLVRFCAKFPSIVQHYYDQQSLIAELYRKKYAQAGPTLKELRERASRRSKS